MSKDFIWTERPTLISKWVSMLHQIDNFFLTFENRQAQSTLMPEHFTNMWLFEHPIPKLWAFICCFNSLHSAGKGFPQDCGTWLQ